MRTTIDLPDDLHTAAVLIARDRHQSLSRTVSDLMRTALAGERSGRPLETDQETGLPIVRLGHRITAEDVASAQDEA
jgi:Arc/MetJ family transcription regulator